MKIHDYLFYIGQDRWDEFLESYEKFGFKREGGFAYPDYVHKTVADGKVLRIGISDPCVNMWDQEDKNGQREIWMWTNRKFGTCNKEIILEYIQDLISAGYVKVNCGARMDKEDET
jgi:hypothetical protein